MAYADYEYYTTAYLGTAIKEDDFPRLSLRASSFLDYYTQGRAAQNSDLENGLLRDRGTVPVY